MNCYQIELIKSLMPLEFNLKVDWTLQWIIELKLTSKSTSKSTWLSNRWVNCHQIDLIKSLMPLEFNLKVDWTLQWITKLKSTLKSTWKSTFDWLHNENDSIFFWFFWGGIFRFWFYGFLLSFQHFPAALPPPFFPFVFCLISSLSLFMGVKFLMIFS